MKIAIIGAVLLLGSFLVVGNAQAALAITLTRTPGNLEPWGEWATYTAVANHGIGNLDWAVKQDCSGGSSQVTRLWNKSGGKVGDATISAPRLATCTAFVVGLDLTTGVVNTGPLSNVLTFSTP